MSPRTVIGGVLRRRPHGSMQAEPDPLRSGVGADRPVRMLPTREQAPLGIGPRVQPLAGPVQVRPVGIERRTAAAMLATVVEGVVLGPADEALLARWSDVLDPADTAILASLLERARIEGPSLYSHPAGPVTGWVMVCSPCEITAIESAPSREDAESLAETHDRLHHGGRPTSRVVPSRESMAAADAPDAADPADLAGAGWGEGR